MPPCNCHPPFPRPEPFSPLPRPGRVPDWGKWIRDRLSEKGALLVLPTRASFPNPGAWPNLYLDLETGAVYRWDREDYAVLVDPREGNDVLVYDSVAAFPDEGEQGKLYIAANTGSLYRWGGEGYVALLEGKADKAVPQAVGNLAALTQDGNLADSGRKPSDFVGKAALFDNPDTSPTVKSSLLPSYVDDVVEYASLSAFPQPGETGKIYVALDTNIQYRWSGTQYTEIAKIIIPSTSAPLVDGTASAGSSEAYSRGDHVHPTDTSRMAASATGADIAVSGTDATKISAALAGKASTADVDPLLFAQYYPDGSVKSAAEFRDDIKYNLNDSNHTATVKPFCNTGDSDNDNSPLSGRVVIPPFVDGDGNPYISDDGTRYKVVDVMNGGFADDNINLTAIVAPNTVTSVGAQAFYYCTALTSVSLPAATSIGEGAFVDCVALASVSLPAATTVVARAFYYCTALTSVSLPAATTVGIYAFEHCTALTSVSLPDATTIRGGAFAGCGSLASVDFGDTPRLSVPTLGADAFSGVPTSCNLIVPDAQYNDWTAATLPDESANPWYALVTAGYKFLKHSEWEYARKYEVDKKADKPTTFTAGNLAALDSNGNPTDSGTAAGDLLTIVTLADSTETMASILARLNAINTAHKHVFFDCSGIDVNPRLYLCTIMIDADANAVRVYDQVTGKLYIGPYVATETIGEVFAKAVDAYHSITVSAVTLDGVTVTGQTVTIREGTDATAPVYATATITDGAPVVFVVPKGMIYFLEITDTLADHFGPRVTSGARQGIATADAAVTFTYYDAEHIDVSEITTFAKLQEALTWFGTNEVAARNNLVGVEIADTWTATNGTVYDNPRVVWDVHYFEDENGVSHLGALMGTKYCSYNDVQFDAAEGEECDSSTETVAEADVYYYGLASGKTSKTAANLTLLELSTGDALPYADYAKIYKSAIRDTTRNSLQYGYDNWRDSAYRQYLNSGAAAGQWWGATHIGDVAPSQLNSVRGFMAGCSTALLAAAKKVKVATWPNSVTDGPNQITTLYETLDTFFLPSGSEVYGDVNRNGGASVEGALPPYWQARTGYTSPNNAAISTRIIYRELPVGSTASRSAAGVRLRSANRDYSDYVWIVGASGQVSNGKYAYGAHASVPACVIY